MKENDKNRRQVIRSLVTLGIACLLLIMLYFGRATISLSKNLALGQIIEKEEDLQIQLTDQVQAARLTPTESEDGSPIYIINAHGSRLRQVIRPLLMQSVTIDNYDGNTPIYYQSERLMQDPVSGENYVQVENIKIYGQGPGKLRMAILPRLALNYYLVLAGIGLLVCLLLSFVGRKKKWGKIFFFLSLFLLSYIVVGLFTGRVTYYMVKLWTRQLLVSGLLALGLYWLMDALGSGIVDKENTHEKNAN